MKNVGYVLIILVAFIVFAIIMKAKTGLAELAASEPSVTKTYNISPGLNYIPRIPLARGACFITFRGVLQKVTCKTKPF